jgi:hypothetical protein
MEQLILLIDERIHLLPIVNLRHDDEDTLISSGTGGVIPHVDDATSKMDDDDRRRREIPSRVVFAHFM